MPSWRPGARAWLLAVGFGVVAALPARLLAAHGAAPTLVLEQTIPLPGVHGRIDHLAFDEASHRLFVAALGNNSVEVVDTASGRHLRSLPGFSQPQGILYRADADRLDVANGGSGEVTILDATTFSVVATLPLGDDADNLRHDPSSPAIYVGFGRGGLGEISTETNTLVSTISLSGHPESFQLICSGEQALVNIPESQEVALLDLGRHRVSRTWKLPARGNFPLAWDEGRHRAFVGCRTPPRVLIYDMPAGRLAGAVDVHGDCDDLFWDAQENVLLVCCGEGFVDIVAEAEPETFVRTMTVKTSRGARTGLWATRRLYVAAPRYGAADASILVFAHERP